MASNVSSTSDIANFISQIQTNKDSQNQTQKKPGSLGKDDFLHLLITQLQAQDPLKPMDDKEFIGQMAQFSSLEQMQNLNKSFVSTKAMGLVDKYITATVTDSTGTKQVKGNVESVKVVGDNAFVVVNGKDISVENINEVKMRVDTTTQTTVGGTSGQ